MSTMNNNFRNNHQFSLGNLVTLPQPLSPQFAPRVRMKDSASSKDLQNLSISEVLRLSKQARGEEISTPEVEVPFTPAFSPEKRPDYEHNRNKPVLSEEISQLFQPSDKLFESPVNQPWPLKGFHSHASSIVPIMTPSEDGSVREAPYYLKEQNDNVSMFSPSGRTSALLQGKQSYPNIGQSERINSPEASRPVDPLYNPAVLNELRLIQRSVQKLQLSQKERDLELQSLMLTIREQKLNEELSRMNQNRKKNLRLYKRETSLSESTNPERVAGSEQVKLIPTEAQTQQSFTPNEKSNKAQSNQDEREQLLKEKQQLMIQIEAEREARNLSRKASQSELALSEEGIKLNAFNQAEKKEQIQRYEEAKERHARKIKDVEMAAHQSHALHQLMIKERREYERKLADFAEQLFTLQEKIDSSKGQRLKAEKILDGSNVFSSENTKLIEELRETNQEGEKRSKEREEVTSIHQQSIAMLKSQISQNKNKSCNNCLLYINEKQNYRLKIEQEERNHKRMERDHHLKKEQILRKCQEAMGELEKAPLSYLHKLHQLQDILKQTDSEKKQLEAKLKNINKLHQKRVRQIQIQTANLKEKEQILETMKRRVQECRERIETHESRVQGLEQEIQECEAEESELKKSNEQITKEVRKNATKQMELKEREGNLEEELHGLRKQKEKLMIEIEALPKKQRDKILKQ